MNVRQIWAIAAGFFLVYILITLTNRPSAPDGGQPTATPTLPIAATDAPSTTPTDSPATFEPSDPPPPSDPATPDEPASPTAFASAPAGFGGEATAATP